MNKGIFKVVNMIGKPPSADKKQSDAKVVNTTINTRSTGNIRKKIPSVGRFRNK
jgi:hypothetical protein